MAKVCDVCGKKPMFGKQISHSHRVSPKKSLPNIKKVRVEKNGSVKNINVCTKCLKSGAVKKVV